MKNNPDIKSLEDWVQHLKSLTAEGRRDFVIKMRDEQTKVDSRLIIYFSVSAFVFSSACLYLWKNAYCMSQESTSGILVGLLLFFIGFQMIKSSLIHEPFRKFYPDHFTDEDIFSYFQKISTANQKASVWARIGRIYFITVCGILFLPLFLHFSCLQYEFSISASASGMSTLMICYTVHIYRKTKMSKSA